MKLTETIEQDLDVFVNPAEFGEIVEISGVKLRAVVIRQTQEISRKDTSTRFGGLSVSNSLHGVNLIGEKVTLYFKSADYYREKQRLPRHSEFITFENKEYQVMETSEQRGIIKVTGVTDRMQI